jgi:hypothetical protein
LSRINVDLSELLAPIRQMREEIQKMNDALRQTVQMQAQMAAHQRQTANSYGPTTAGAALQIRDLVAARGGPTSNVYSIGTGSPIPPSNINPTGSPLGSPLPSAQWQLSRGGIGIASAFAGQAGFQNDLAAKREREEAVKILSGSANTTAKILLDVSKKFEQERATASETLKRATDDYGKASEAGAKDLAKFAKELDEAAKKFNKVNQKAEQFSTTLDDFIKKGGPGGGGGGDGGGRGGFGGWWDKYGGKVGFAATGIASTAALGFQLASTFSGVQAMGLQQGLGAMQAIPQNIAATESLRYQKYMATVAPTTGEQMLEAYGNLLTPGKKTFSYLGVGNRQARETAAGKMFDEELKVSEAERKATTRSAIGGGILKGFGSAALLKMGFGVAATGVGLVPGLAMMGAGAYGLLTSGSDLFSSISGAQTGLAGKKEGGIFDMPGAGLLFDDADARAQQVKGQYQSEVALTKEQNERKLIDAEKQRFAARRLSMGLDENIAAMRMRTAATSMAGGAAVSGFEMFKNMPEARANAITDRYASLGYSVPEVGQIYNTYAGMTGTTQGANRLLGLSRAGVGSVEQMASNVLGISAVSGKQGDTKQLENIFAKAFEAGLKGAPAIQRFSQAAMEMSQALKIQSASGAAGFLSQLTGAMRGSSGSAMMYMEEAKSGLAGLAGATGATTGLMGTLKVLAGAGAGLTMGTGLGLASRSNVVQVQEALQQLSAGGDYKKMTGLAREMVGAQIASGMSPEAATANVRRQLQAQSSAQLSPFGAELKRRTGQDFSTMQAEAKSLLKKGDAEGLKNLMSRFKDLTTGMAGLEAEGSAAAYLLSGVDPGDFKRGKNILAQEKGKGAAVAAADFTTVNYKRMLNSAAVDASKGINRDVSDQELIKTATGMGLKGTDQEKIQQLKGAAGVKSGEQMTFSKLTTAMSLLSDTEGVRSQNTVIQDFSDKAIDKLANAMKGKTSNETLTDRPGAGASSVPEKRPTVSRGQRG